MSEGDLFTYPTETSKQFTVVELPTVPVNYLTVVLRNHRILEEGGTFEHPILRREFIDDDEMDEISHSLCQRLHDLGGVQLRFIGEGFDPVGTRSSDEEAIEKGMSVAVICDFEEDRYEDARAIVKGLISEYRLLPAWFLATPIRSADSVVR